MTLYGNTKLYFAEPNITNTLYCSMLHTTAGRCNLEVLMKSVRHNDISGDNDTHQDSTNPSLKAGSLK